MSREEGEADLDEEEAAALATWLDDETADTYARF